MHKTNGNAGLLIARHAVGGLLCLAQFERARATRIHGVETLDKSGRKLTAARRDRLLLEDSLKATPAPTTIMCFLIQPSVAPLFRSP